LGNFIAYNNFAFKIYLEFLLNLSGMLTVAAIVPIVTRNVFNLDYSFNWILPTIIFTMIIFFLLVLKVPIFI
jgi:hypothetical protein